MRNTRVGVGVLLCSALGLVFCWLKVRETPPVELGTSVVQPEGIAPRPPGTLPRPTPLRLRRPDMAQGKSDRVSSFSDAPRASATPELALRRAVLQFQFESQPALDGCLGPEMPTSRSPQPIRILFTRQASQTHFVAARVEPLSTVPAQAINAPSPRLKSCLASLQGRSLQLQAPLSDEQLELDQVITLLIPS